MWIVDKVIVVSALALVVAVGLIIRDDDGFGRLWSAWSPGGLGLHHTVRAARGPCLPPANEDRPGRGEERLTGAPGESLGESLVAGKAGPQFGLGVRGKEVGRTRRGNSERAIRVG